MGKNLEIGRKGEILAAQYLQNRGYTILHINWRAGKTQNEKGEIDIVAQKQGTLHFVEVKSRTNSHFQGDFAPANAMHRKKNATLARVAEKYIEINEIDQIIQFDLITVNFLPNNSHSISYLANVLR